MKHELTVGLEIHVELETETKMFCGCKNDPFNAGPNEHVCPVCYGLPGALPLLNRRAVEMTLRLGQALNGRRPNSTFWARKNYFYPDLPKGYQITQSNAPLVEEATLVIDGSQHRIERIHLEEDAGKLTHDPANRRTLVNYNRAGVPLLELVTKPDFKSAESAKHFCQELQRVMRHLKLSSADMEKGQMRCEANISVAQAGAELGTKVEVKNLNSFRSVERAINYEFERQTKVLESGERVDADTRLWDEKNSRTEPMRSKETSADYRYFPEPDLPTVILAGPTEGDSSVLPDEQRSRLRKLGLPEAVAKIIVDRNQYDSIMETYELATRIYKSDDWVKRATCGDANLRVSLPKFAELNPKDRLVLLERQQSMGWAKSVLLELIDEAINTNRPIEELARAANTGEEGLARVVIEENPEIVEDYRGGNINAVNALVGKMMIKASGRINAARARETLQKLLG